jgi:DNA polymerase III subunit epsilon
LATLSMQPDARIAQTDFAVIDLETTGLFPAAHDRVLEVAVLRYRPDGTLQRQWVSLVDPQRDLGATHVHGVSAADVQGAPTFEHIVGEVCRLLCGAVVVGHNARFDVTFLAAEFARAGFHLPPLPVICTMTLPTRLGLPSAGRSLKAACDHWGVAYDPDRAHGAQHDAEATAGVFGRLLETAWKHGARTLAELGCTCAIPPEDAWPAPGPTVRTHGRGRAHSQRQQKFGYLATVARRLAEAPRTGPAELAPYLDLLDRVLEDHVVTDAEAQGLLAIARDLGLSAEQVSEAHRLHLDSLVDAAWANGAVSAAERRELETVGFWLGLDSGAVTAIVNDRRPAGAQGSRDVHSRRSGTRSHPLAGMRVCFTGMLGCTYQGQPLTRSRAQMLAEQAGLVVAERVTKELDLLVVADPDTQSGKAIKARSYGTRLMAEPVFWRTIGVPVE